MSKSSPVFACSKCGAQFSKWAGRCEECGAWGTVSQETANIREAGVQPAVIIAGADIPLNEQQIQRLTCGNAEIDRVFGNGLVPGSLILLGGEPGIGKSTLTAQIANHLAQNNHVVYLSGEESLAQISLRLKRLNCDVAKLFFLTETDLDAALAALNQQPPQLLIIDSVQTVYSSQEPGAAGSLNQIRAAAAKLLDFAKTNSTAVIMTGHITKDGQVAGPKSLEHLVDTVIYLEYDPSQAYRLLKTTKNRFGPTNEIGVLEMTGAGLVAVADPTSLFLPTSDAAAAGTALTAVAEGSRIFLVEVQALVTKTVFGYPQRRASGFDLNRLQVLATVISKRAGLNLMSSDIILNLAGGLKATDPGLDLAVCLAIASAARDQALDPKQLICGEVGLTGEVRGVARLADRLTAAERLGLTSALVPAGAKIKTGLKLYPVATLAEALKRQITINH